MIYLYIGNHGYNIHTQDIFEYIQSGLEDVGAKPNYHFNKFTSDGINIVLEMFDDNLTKSVLAFQESSINSKLFIIVSESLLDGTFNSANNQQKSSDAAANHYEDANYWKNRHDNFIRLLPVTSGVITIAEHQHREYLQADLGVPLFYLPMVALPSYQPIRHLPFEQKDIDIFFSGTITEYRKRILGEFTDPGLHLVTTSPRNPDYLRRHFLERSKLALGLKLDESTRLLSKARAHYYLTRECPHLFEAVQEPTELDDFLEFSGHPDIVKATLHRLQQRPQFNAQSLRDFAAAHPYDAVFSSLLAFLNDAPARR